MALRTQWVGIVGLLVAIAAIGQGCAAKPEMAERNVIVSLDGSIPPGTTVEVNVIAANATEYSQLWSKPVTEYWDQGGGASGDVKRMRLDGTRRSETLQSTDAIWQKWRGNGAMHLFVITHVPGLSGSGVGDQDPRRAVLPLDKNRWEKLGDIEVIVTRAGLKVPTQPKPPAKP